MINEKAVLKWKKTLAHVPPEFPKPLEEHIKYFAPGWKIAKQTDDVTGLESPDKSTYITSGKGLTLALCRSEFTKNYDNLRSVGDIIKKLAVFTNVKDMRASLSSEPCSISVELAMKLTGTEKFRIRNLAVSYGADDKTTTLNFSGNYYGVVEEYKHNLSNVRVLISGNDS